MSPSSEQSINMINMVDASKHPSMMSKLAQAIDAAVILQKRSLSRRRMLILRHQQQQSLKPSSKRMMLLQQSKSRSSSKTQLRQSIFLKVSPLTAFPYLQVFQRDQATHRSEYCVKQRAVFTSLFIACSMSTQDK